VYVFTSASYRPFGEDALHQTNDDLMNSSPTPAPPAAQLNSSHGSFELVVSPILLGLLGWWLDRSVLDTTPVLTIILSMLGLVGAVIKIYFGYTARMAAHAQESVWASHE